MSRNYKSSPLPAVEATNQDASAYSFVTNPNNTDRSDYGTAGGRDGGDGGLHHRAHRSAPLPSMAIEEEEETFKSAIFQLTSYAGLTTFEGLTGPPENDPPPVIEYLEGVEKIGDVVEEKHKQNALQASLSIIKCMVGAGSFALPYAVMNAGLWGGAIGLFLLGIMTIYTNRVLMDCKDSLYEFQGRYVSYYHVCQFVLGDAAGMFVYASILVISAGACSGYLIFCSQLLNGTVYPGIPYEVYVLALGIPLMMLSWMKGFSYLAFTSILGDVAMTIGMVSVFWVGFTQYSDNLHWPWSDAYGPPVKWLTLPQAFGPAAFLFCIQHLNVPIQCSMRKQSQFPKALTISYVIVMIANTVFACMGYMFFIDNTNPLVINNLGTGVIGIVASVALVADLFFTYLIVLVPARDLLEESIFYFFSFRTAPHSYRCVIRSGVVALTMVVALVIRDFTTITDLVSGLCLSAMAFIFPPLLRLALRHKHNNKGNYLLMNNGNTGPSINDKQSTPSPTTSMMKVNTAPLWSLRGLPTTLIDIVFLVFGIFCAISTSYVGLINTLEGWNINVDKWQPANW